MKERRPLVEDIQNYAQNIVDTVREPLLGFQISDKVEATALSQRCVGNFDVGGVKLSGDVGSRGFFANHEDLRTGRARKNEETIKDEGAYRRA